MNTTRGHDIRCNARVVLMNTTRGHDIRCNARVVLMNTTFSIGHFWLP